jgi:DNA-binding transcriptional LysR family regulator
MVPDTNSALSVASRTDMTTLAPRRLALLAADGGRLRLIEPPYASPPMQVNLVYLHDRLAEPAIAWMRELIREAAGSI